MGDVIYLFKGKVVRNFESYYLESGAYIEEFDTDDGHFCLGADIPDYPPDVREEAIELGIIDEQGNLLPWDSKETVYF